MKKEKDNILFVSYSRVLAMFFVILVHLCQQSMNSYVVGTAQFFITGVTIFIILTGYIYGKKAKAKEYPQKISSWVVSRANRVLIPYYIVVAFVFVLDVILLKEQISWKQILMMATCTQDFCGDLFYRMQGVGHLWYITMLVLSYMMIGLCFEFRNQLKTHRGGVILVFAWILQIMVTLFVHAKLGRYVFYILLCISAFYVGSRRSERKISVGRKWAALALITGAVWMLRLGLYFRGCDSYWYNNLFTYYSQALMSVFIVYSLYFLEQKGLIKENKLLTRLDKISYEVFLIHYAFIDGPLKVINTNGNLVVEGTLVISLSILCGYSIYILCEMINRKVRNV